MVYAFQIVLNEHVLSSLFSTHRRVVNSFPLHRSKAIYGYLNDYAFFIRGLLDLYECTFDSQWVEWCERLQDVQNDLFWNSDTRIYNMISQNDHFSSLPQGGGWFIIIVKAGGF